RVISMSTEGLAYATIVRALEVLNKSGKYRAALITSSVKREPELVLHGNIDLVRGIACSNVLETTAIFSDHATVTLPIVDYGLALEEGVGDDLVKAVTDGMEAESRPRRNLYQRDKANPNSIPPQWPPNIPFGSLNAGNRKKFAHDVLKHMQEYKDKRWDNIMNGQNLEQYDRTQQILEDDEKKLSTKQREARNKKRMEV
ncbi:hypothetical protein PMAYCL1PPCAC_20932, partial [Pristionchus mayeri]